jgi:hypothetical protein
MMSNTSSSTVSTEAEVPAPELGGWYDDAEQFIDSGVHRATFNFLTRGPRDAFVERMQALTPRMVISAVLKIWTGREAA